jgi:hypothetical protein
MTIHSLFLARAGDEVTSTADCKLATIHPRGVQALAGFCEEQRSVPQTEDYRRGGCWQYRHWRNT